MKTKKRLVITVTSGILLIGFVAFVCSSFFSSNSREMMALVLEWGRLAPFPVSATDVSVKTEGSSFTRSFRASFVAPKQDIESWIKESPGLNEATPKELPAEKAQYIIAPGGDANYAEVTIDYILGQVEIYVSWD